MVVIHRMKDPIQLAERAAEFIREQAQKAITRHGRFDLVLSGGSTPEATYQSLMAGGDVEWPSVYLYWGDERCVPPTDAASNFRMADRALISSVPVPEEHIFRIHGEDDPQAAAEAYQRVLETRFADEGQPRFDLVLLGLGPEAHTASLFPGTLALKEEGRWVVPNYVDKLTSWRVTLTPAAINSALQVLFLVQGKEKAPAVRQVLEGDRNPIQWPAQMIQPTDGTAHWFLDEEAASLLRNH